MVGARIDGPASSALVIGLLVTDRFLELFAFGGLLQIAAMTFMG